MNDNLTVMPIHPTKTHPLTGEPLTAVHIDRNGRPRWPIMGAAEDDDGGEGEDDGGDDEAGLLDDEADNGGTGDGDGGSDGGDDGQVDEDALIEKVVKALEGRFDSIADRRVNAIVKEVRKQGGKPGKKEKDTDDDAGGQQQEVVAGPSAGDVREARLAYREYVSDEIKFLGTVEREHAMAMAQGLIPNLLEQGNDPDEAGAAVAKKVSEQVKALRQHYEQKTLSALKRKGLLAEDGRGDGAPAHAGGTTVGDKGSFSEGQKTAARLLADRMPAETN